MTLDPKHVVEVFRAWKGRWFKPGVVERCADFIRTVFREELKWDPPVTAYPLDYEQVRHIYPEPPGPDAAASLSGPEIGKQVSEPEPGDLVFFRNTYPGFPPGCITHVGLYVGDGLIIDRPTASKPVQERAVGLFDYTGWPPLYVRPKVYQLNVAPKETIRARIFGEEVSAVLQGGTAKVAVRPVAMLSGWQAEPVVGGKVLVFKARGAYPDDLQAFSLDLTIINGPGYVNARELASGLGLSVFWNPTKKEVSFERPE
jgi:hypothetical protein